MAVRIVCSACSCEMHVAEELRGKRIKCKSCGGVVPVEEVVQAQIVEFAEPKRLPPAMPSRRRVVDEDDDDRPSPRRRRKEKTAGANLLPLWFAGGGVLVLIVVIVLVLVLRSGTDPVQPNNNQPLAQNQPQDQPPPQQVQPAANVAPERRNAPPLIADPPAGETMKGEKIYERLLQSTVWIVASHKINAAGANRPFAQDFEPIPQLPVFAQPGLPPRPGFPRPPNLRPPNFPNMPGEAPNLLPQAGQTSNLRNSTWSGSETLPGFGKLTFQFISNISVIMVDAKETSRGSFIHTGNNVTLTFGGGVVYNGTVNGNSMSGNANNGMTNWTWNVTRAGGGGATPVNPGPGGGVKSTGSGSLIDRKHRLVITNVHVVGNGNAVTVYFPDFDAKGDLVVHSDAYRQKPGLTGRVVMREERADLALVQLDALPEGVQPLALAGKKASPAQQVHSVGNPGASKALWVYSPGKIRQVLKDQWKIFDDLEGRAHHYDAMKIETDSAINPGDSGGPLVDDRAAMVGVAHGGSLVANNFSYFIEASEVRQLLERYYRSVNDALPK